MDFNAIVNKLREIEPTDISNPDAVVPQSDAPKAAPVVLSEAAQLRVKAGISTVLEESKKVQVEEAVEMCPEACCGKPVTECKCGPDCEHCDCHAKNAAMKESVETVEESKVKEVESKFVNKGAKLEKVKVKNESEEKLKTFDEEIENILESTKSKLVKEAKKKPDENNNGIPDYAEDGKGPNDLAKGGKKPAAKKAPAKKSGKKEMSAKQKKFFGKKTESVVATKKAVAESMSFLDAIKIVKESNGEMKVNAVDTVLWNWAKRVAASKVTEGGIKEEAFAAKVYESRGGIWDVSKTIISE